MKLLLQTPKKALNKAYLKEKVGRADIELFRKNFTIMLGRINEAESEENGKNIAADFLKNTWYGEAYEINTKDRKDLVIHAGKTAKDAVGAILEVKKPSNKVEMISAEKPNAKALQELILYYLQERIDKGAKFIRHLIITNLWEWYIIDEVWFEKYIFGSTSLKKDYADYKAAGKPTHFFYDSIAKPFIDALDAEIPCTHFNILDYKKYTTNTDRADDHQLIALYKIFSPAHLLKEAFANDSNSLDKAFYEELLHIIGLEEVKDGGKKLIKRKRVPDEASLLENAIAKIDERDSLYEIDGYSAYGAARAEQTESIALELCITWVNRILFMKLLEAQLLKYHGGAKDYIFLNTGKVHDWDELSNLFFRVLAERPVVRSERLRQKFATVPYLNSSLFERTALEKKALEIALLDNRLTLPLHRATVLKDEKGKRRTGALPTLEYLFAFLDAYDFSSEGAEEIQEENKNLINASVLGLIFEKINGYKDGSFFTPGFVTMYMCRETLRRAVVQKFNRVIRIGKCDPEGAPDRYATFDDLKDAIGRDTDREIANDIINSLTICDPAVGSGHFLVSALNELLAIKSELRIFCDREGKSLHFYNISVVNDELVVTDDNGDLFAYRPRNAESRRVQEALFHEKQTIIENCLFGVDINPNSVKICRLRLWIELLKHAYYTGASGYTELETLPNIDINIKTGNSLISRFGLDADLGAALKTIKYDISAYQGFVRDYKSATDKEEKRGLEKIIADIKTNFRTAIGLNDPKLKRLNKVSGEYELLMNQAQIFELSKAEGKARKATREKLEKEITKLTAEVEAIRSNRIYENAFEWRFEFPEVLDAEGRFVGFDVVIGNPPYVQLQKLGKGDKAGLLQQGYETYAPTGDLYQLFYEHGVDLLRPNGLLCYITSNKWMRTDYGKVTRNYFATKTNTEFVIDFGMTQMFDSATTYTNILLLIKEVPSDSVQMCRLKEGYDLTIPLAEYAPRNFVETENLGAGSWIAYSVEEYDLIKRIEVQGKPLTEWNIQINRGLLTGLNEAFIITTETRNKLIAEDPKSADVIKPILRGEDVKAYAPDWADKWIVFIPWHFPLHLDPSITGASVEAEKLFEEQYPAIYSHLLKFKSKLSARNKAETGIRYEWYALQRWASNYYEDFLKPKIIYPNMTKYLPFLYDKHQFYFVNDKAFIMTGESLEYLTAFFNSKLFKFAFKEYFPELLGDTRELRKVFFETIPVMPAQEDAWFVKMVELIASNKREGLSISDYEEQIDNKLFDFYGLTETERSLICESVEPATFSRDLISAISVAESE